MSIVNQPTAHIPPKINNDDEDTNDKPDRENSAPRSHPSQYFKRPRNFSPWSSQLSTSTLSPPQPAKLSRSPARGVLLNLTKTPPRASYAEKVKGIFAGHRRSSEPESAATCEVTRAYKTVRKYECDDEIKLPDGRRARVIKTQKRIFLQYVDDEAGGMLKTGKSEWSTSESSAAAGERSMSGSLTSYQMIERHGATVSEEDPEQIADNVGCKHAKGKDPSAEASEDVPSPEETKFDLYTTSCELELGKDRSAFSEDHLIEPDQDPEVNSAAMPKSIPKPHLLFAVPEDRSPKKKRERRVKITPATIPFSPPWKPTKTYSSKHTFLVDSEENVDETAHMPLLTTDDLSTDEVQIPQLDGVLDTIVRSASPSPPPYAHNVDIETPKMDKVPIKSLGQVSSIQSLLSPPWKVDAFPHHPLPLLPQGVHTIQPPLNQPPPSQLNAAPTPAPVALLMSSPGPRAVKEQLGDKYDDESSSDESSDESSDAWTDDSQFLPAYTMRRRKREARRRQRQQKYEDRSHMERAVTSRAESILSLNRTPRKVWPTTRDFSFSNQAGPSSPRPSRFMVSRVPGRANVQSGQQGLRGSTEVFEREVVWMTSEDELDWPTLG